VYQGEGDVRDIVKDHECVSGNRQLESVTGESCCWLSSVKAEERSLPRREAGHSGVDTGNGLVGEANVV
jgi:hypothetical protein